MGGRWRRGRRSPGRRRSGFGRRQRGRRSRSWMSCARRGAGTVIIPGRRCGRRWAPDRRAGRVAAGEVRAGGDGRAAEGVGDGGCSGGQADGAVHGRDRPSAAGSREPRLIGAWPRTGRSSNSEAAQDLKDVSMLAGSSVKMRRDSRDLGVNAISKPSRRLPPRSFPGRRSPSPVQEAYEVRDRALPRWITSGPAGSAHTTTGSSGSSGCGEAPTIRTQRPPCPPRRRHE